MRRIGVLGDDLTGVTAVLAEAAELGLQCWVSPAETSEPEPGTDVWGINLASRDGGTDVNAIRTALARLRDWGSEHVVLKIDSLWRGNPMALIHAASEHGTPVVISGAAPFSSIPNATLIAEANPFVAAASLRTQHDSGQTLWVGGVGLLTIILWAGIAQPAPVAAVVGSYQPIIANQVAAFRSAGALALPADTPDLAKRINDAWSSDTLVVIETMPKKSTSPDPAAAERCYRKVADALTGNLAGKNFGLILTGGHTASTVLNHLAADALRLTGPTAVEGAPLLASSLPALSGGLIATKPGHFGESDALLRISIQIQLRLSVT